MAFAAVFWRGKWKETKRAVTGRKSWRACGIHCEKRRPRQSPLVRRCGRFEVFGKFSYIYIAEFARNECVIVSEVGSVGLYIRCEVVLN
jgi:hypothetical protein